MEAPPEPRSRRRARALPPQHGPAMASHVASTWPRPCCTAQPPPAALYARTTVRLRLWVPSMGTDKMPVRPGRPCAAMAMATRLMAETGMMMPASGSDGSCWSKVAEMQQLRMPPHERQWSTTLLPLSRSRTPPSRSQHIDCCTLEDRVAAGISLLGRGCGALGAERGNKTSERLFRPFCPLLDPPRFGNSQNGTKRDFCLFAPAAAALGSQAARWRAHPVPTDRCGARCSIGVACESPTAAQLALCSLGNLGRRARAERGWARDDAPVDQKGAFAIRTATATRTATCRSFTRTC